MEWEGYEMETGTYNTHEYGIVFPAGFQKGSGCPYIWRAEFFGAFPTVDLAMLKEGYAVVYYRIPDLYGSPAAVRKMEKFQPFIQEKYGLAPQVTMFGFSRGGLYALHYAAKYPERVASLYLDAPVVDIYSWPGGFGLAPQAAEWEECRALWNKTREEFRDVIDAAIQTLLDWSIPLVMVAGGKDETVPYCENGALIEAAYKKSDVLFQVIIKSDCGHHPHSLENPEPVVEFLLKNRVFPSEGNAFRINDQSLTQYPLVLMVHDRAHIGLVSQAERIFSGRLPFGYIGTSPWPGSVTNQRTLCFHDPLNISLYDFLQAQMEIMWVLYGWDVEGEEDAGAAIAFLKKQKEKCPNVRQVWLKQKEVVLSASFLSGLKEHNVEVKEYGSPEGLAAYFEALGQEVLQAKAPAWFDTFDREAAEWTNVSITLPRKETENRILLVGDSISAGYGDLVQKKMPGFHVDRLNTSEGIHHPNFLRLLEIVLRQYPYRLVHINNGIHLHGQKTKQYGDNLWAVFQWIHMLSPQTGIIFATTTPLSRRLGKEEMENIDIYHFSMGDRAPQAVDGSEEYWVVDEKASAIYQELNEKAKEICVLHGIPVNDLYGLCVAKNLQKSDGVHFTGNAYQALSEQIADVLMQFIIKLDPK